MLKKDMKNKATKGQRNEIGMFLNQRKIDKFIDNYWFMKCPQGYNRWEIDESIRQLIRKIFLFGVNPPKIKKKAEAEDAFKG
mmetsp:Transcript_19028/g.29178  ORF Transcript_19028/g.29178 Transcript_19028/m.29178 type:complete len:82 (+) Transcript_19028:1196-1441(+)